MRSALRRSNRTLHRVQNRTLAISSIWRAPTLVPVIWPKWPGPISLSGRANDGWFRTFVALALKSTLMRSVILKILWSDIFTAVSPGPDRAFLPRLPKVPGVGAANALGLNQE